jgi:short subunit dehydrogenase-like uncharacterized protein
MSSPDQQVWIIYGAYGFTGRLVVEAALRSGHRPVLAGRDARQLAAMAASTGLAVMPLSLDDPAALQAAVHSKSLVFMPQGRSRKQGRRSSRRASRPERPMPTSRANTIICAQS